MKATISGRHVEVPENPVRASVLLPLLLEVLEMDRRCFTEDESTGGAVLGYYLPRQNMPNGATGDGHYEFDLCKCSDFVLVPMPGANHVSDVELQRRYRQVNLYGEWSPEAIQSRLCEGCGIDPKQALCMCLVEVGPLTKPQVRHLRQGLSHIWYGRGPTRFETELAEHLDKLLRA